MKRLVCLILVLLFAACAAPKTAVEFPDSAAIEPVALGFDVPKIESYDGFAYTLSAALLDGTENRNLSPLSVYFALAMTAEGANGNTLADLLRLLGSDSLDALRETAGTIRKKLTRDAETGEVRLCNSLWMTDAYPLKETFQKQLEKSYDADAETVDFTTDKAKRRIAKWIREKTNDRIDPSPDALDFDSETLAVLINTVYFCDQWAHKFYEGSIRTDTFTRADGTEMTVDYLNRFDDMSYITRGDGFLRYSLRLESRGRVTFVLPDEGAALKDLLGTPEQLETLLSGGEEIFANVDLKLPKLSFSDRFDLEDVLCALGLADAFRKDADFSGMTDWPARLDRVIQETFIDLNENGVEAAAYTMVIPAAEEMPPQELETIEFHLNRPFLFVIESYDGTVLFIGTVTEPTAHQ